MHNAPVEPPPRPPDPRATIRVTLVLAGCSLTLLVLVALEWRPLVALDDGIARTTHRWAVQDPNLTQACRILTDWVWDPNTMRLLVGAVVIWLAWRRSTRWTAGWLLAAVALGTVVQQSLKAAVGRARPVWPDPVDSAHYAAFPSGHAMTATVVCGLLLWLLHRHGVDRALWRAALALALVSVIGVGLTRVWLGVHWFTDVVGGWLVGALVVAAAVTVHQRVETPAEPQRNPRITA
ncbi:phosphatase PAP2 family protein [Streptomyces sp. B93]|uniref:phosphatase PAP2 family protein n=1 Tax=Streptomyces sp. B93 TaxID=2824875 RepID=UPI001B399401|nr:phosphatase PAP2 family protein [Streptomyces sp. B93]MBQ1092559.1 phosphatase PAP2 family protein [Streptomyces sp. B93]